MNHIDPNTTPADPHTPLWTCHVCGGQFAWGHDCTK